MENFNWKLFNGISHFLLWLHYCETSKNAFKTCSSALGKKCPYSEFSGMWIAIFGLNTVICTVNLRVQSKYAGKCGPEKLRPRIVFTQCGIISESKWLSEIYKQFRVKIWIHITGQKFLKSFSFFFCGNFLLRSFQMQPFSEGLFATRSKNL